MCAGRSVSLKPQEKDYTMQSPNVFQVGGSDLFDSTMHTQGGLPHLMQYLWDAYVVHLQKQLEKLTESGKTAVTIDEAKKRAPATHFAVWATEHLKEVRVTESFFVDANHGLRLGNNAMVAVCPGAEIRGTMQEANAVQVTKGESQPHQHGIVGNDGALRI